MKPSFAARRKPRTIARDGPEDNDAQEQSEAIATSAVKRPGVRSKTSSSRQISFAGSASRTTSQQPSNEEEDTFIVKKSSLSRQAIAQNARRKAGIRLPDDRLPIRSEEESRPTYSREELALLKHSTPGTPAEVSDQDEQALDIAAKFGSAYQKSGNIIPSAAEISERKARRARLAQEARNGDEDSDDDVEMPDPDELGHDSDEDEFRKQVSHVSLSDPRKQKYPETRIMHDDEDVLEGFDDFTGISGGRINTGVGRKAEREAAAQKRREMEDMIADAEGGTGGGDSGDEESDDSDRIRRDAYDAVQTQKAMGREAANAAQARDDALPPKLPPIPTLDGVLDKLRRAVEEVRWMKEAKQREMDEVEQERREIAERQGELQQALKETAEQYRKLAIEAGLTISNEDGIDVNGALAMSTTHGAQRGLENLA